MRRSVPLAALLALAACSPQPEQRKNPPGGTPVLRVLYRDDAYKDDAHKDYAHKDGALMLLTLPSEPDGPQPSRDCAAPLLIDLATGSAHPLSSHEVAQRLKTMRIAGATPGRCQDAALKRT